MSILHTPSLSMLLFFSERHLPPGASPVLSLANRLTLTAETAKEEQYYCGVLEDNLTCTLREILAHDTVLLRCDLVLAGNHPAGAWERLRQRGEAILEAVAEGKPGSPWGVTLVYHAVLGTGLRPEDLPDLLAGLPPPAVASPPSPESTPYGWLLTLDDGTRKAEAAPAWRQRCLLLLVPEERAGKVAHYFLSPLRQGVARIERHLHKALYHADLQEESSAALSRAILQLRERMMAAVSTTEFADLYRESRELEQISVLLMSFLNQKAHSELVLHSLRINLQDFVAALEEVKLATPSYERKKLFLSQRIRQLESDLEYARVVGESTYAFQEMQRGVENNRLQRASLMLGTAAALLAGITIFNSFLDIWALILEGSGWVLPPMGMRMGIGLLAGIAWPMTAYWLIERRHKMFILWAALGVLSFALALLGTLWINR